MSLFRGLSDFVFSWKPTGLQKTAMLTLISAVSAVTVGLHYHVGLDYEFHIFLSVPVLTAAWVLGAIYGMAIAAGTVALWFVADWMLWQNSASPEPLVFNTAMRLTISLVGAGLMAELRSLLDGYRELAFIDPLTKLPNRRGFLEAGRITLAMAERQDAPITCVFVDLDRFKEVNDTLGHHAGDALLRVVANGLSRYIRASDIPGRLGGDEFAILLPDMAPGNALTYVEGLRTQLLDLMRTHQWPVTFSIGVATYARPPGNIRAMLADADGLMYEVKRTGRDRVLIRPCDVVSAPLA